MRRYSATPPQRVPFIKIFAVVFILFMVILWPMVYLSYRTTEVEQQVAVKVRVQPPCTAWPCKGRVERVLASQKAYRSLPDQTLKLYGQTEDQALPDTGLQVLQGVLHHGYSRGYLLVLEPRKD